MRLKLINCYLRFRLPVTATFKLTFASNSLYKGAWGFNDTFDVYRLKIGDTNITMTNHLKLVDDGCCLSNRRKAITDTIDCCVELCKSVPVPSQLRGVLKYTWSIPKIFLSSLKNISKYLMSDTCRNDDVEGFVNVWHFINTTAEIRWRWFCVHNHHHDDHWNYDDNHHVIIMMMVILMIMMVMV